MFTKFVASAATVLVAVSLSLVGIATTASATGTLGDPGTSNGPTPYTVGATGITLPGGAVFKDNQEINVTSSPTGTNVHFEAKCVTRTDAECAGDPHTLAQYIGTSFIPWSAFHLSGSFCVSWVQVGGYNEHFGEGGQAPVCSMTADATAAAPTKVTATCNSGQTLTLGAITNATWGTVTGGTGPSSYSVTATAIAGHTFSDGTTAQTFTGTLSGPLATSDPACKVAPVCIPNSSVSYTYLPGSNGGVITVTDLANSTGVLCHPFWVTATAWLYTKDAVWPQALDTSTTEYLPEISTPGSYPYAAQVTCGQGDIYASTVSEPMPTPVLNGPDTPYVEHFLHDMGFTGPTPTYVQQATSCNTVTPVATTASAITSCGVYGSVSVPASTAAVSYAETGAGNVGDYTVTATVNSPYTLASGATTSWTFHLGQYAPCTAPCTTMTVAPVSTNLDNAGWTFGESRSGGHHEYVASGLHIWTDGSGSDDKSAGYVATNFPLSQAGSPGLAYTNSSGGSAPGLQFSVSVNGTSFGNLVSGPLFTGWWSSRAVPGMPAGPDPSYQLSYGSLDDYLFAWAQHGVTNVQVEAVGYALGSGAKGDGIVTSITADCVTYSFTSKSYAPTASYTLGACYPNGNFSSKNLYFQFDNSASDVPVTFTVAGTTISDQVAAHSTDTIEGTPIWDQGGGYDVYADGKLLTGLTIPSFTGCLDTHPGDPSVTPELCTNGVVSNGSITVDLKPGLIYSITGVGNATNITEVKTTETFLPAGTYKVGVTARPGFVLSGADNWPLTRIVLPPVHCEVITPLSAKITTDLGCTTGGSYTIPQQDGVIWKVDGMVTMPNTYQVTTPSTVDVTAEPADSTWGFAAAAQTDWPLTFAAPVGCDLGTLADQPTNATAADETCGPDGSPVDGSITVGQVMGVDFSKVVDYRIDGKPVTRVTTLLPAGTYDVTATPQGRDGLDGPDRWTLTIAGAAAVCGDLKTLALTGSNEFGWIALAVMLLQLGVGVLAIRAALIRRRRAQHRVG